MMLAQLLRPFRGHGNRLLATSVGAKTGADNEQLHLLSPGDAAFTDKKANPSLPAKCREESSALVGRLSRWFSKSISPHLAIENEPHYMFAPGDGELYTPEPYSAVPPASDSSNAFANSMVANVMVAWPTQSMFNGNIDRPSWVDMGLYQMPLAPYQQQEGVPQQAPSGPFLTTAVLMQPMLMPVFYPCGIMQMPLGSEQPAPNVTIASAGDQADRNHCEAPEVTCQGPTITATGDHQADSQQCEASEETRQGPRHRRSRRGGAAARKKLAAARQSEDVDDAARAVETEQVCSSSTTQVSSDLALKDDIQSLSTEAGTPKAADDDSTSASSIHCEMVLDTKSTPNEARTIETIDPLLVELDSSDEERRQLTLDWVERSFWPLALTRRGSRILQQAISVGTPAYQQDLLGNMRGQVQEAMQSPHANHVLQKFIEILPPERTHFVASELQDKILHVARHRFGCRILQRLVEHHAPQQTEQMIDKVLMDAASLCRHQYGNYVIQHILQHGSPSQRSAIAEVVKEDIIRLSKHRVASHVVSSAMVHCPAEDVQRLTKAVLHDAGQLAELSRREYGSFVVREVNRAARLLRDEQ